MYAARAHAWVPVEHAPPRPMAQRAGGGPRKAALDFNTGRYRADSGPLNMNLIYAQAVLYCV
ncbi:hypothetical protein [Streptomyces nigrescens]